MTINILFHVKQIKMTREQYNQANDYVSQIDNCETIILQTMITAEDSSATIQLYDMNFKQAALINIEDAALIEGLLEYIKAWYTNRKIELERLLSEI